MAIIIKNLVYIITIKKYSSKHSINDSNYKNAPIYDIKFKVIFHGNKYSSINIYTQVYEI